MLILALMAQQLAVHSTENRLEQGDFCKRFYLFRLWQPV